MMSTALKLVAMGRLKSCSNYHARCMAIRYDVHIRQLQGQALLRNSRVISSEELQVIVRKMVGSSCVHVG